MLDLKSLPKVPEEALSVLLIDLTALVPVSQNTLKSFWAARKESESNVKYLIKAANITAKRVEDKELREFAQNTLIINEAETLEEFGKRIEAVQNFLIAAQFDQHFLDEKSADDFDRVELTESEKASIRELLAKARRLTTDAQYLSAGQKRKVVYHISCVENELFKDISRFNAFIAAAHDVSSFVKQFGKDAKPLAEAIQTAKSIPESKLEGYKRIETEEKPKQITGPDE